jgi:succinate dehydrogenase / fumarate reductase membrane anchor subunit
MATPAETKRAITKYGAYNKPGKGATGWETFSWYFFRLSGIGLIFLALAHVFIVHVQNDVSGTV